MPKPIAVFAAALVRAFMEAGHRVRYYTRSPPSLRAYWDKQARKVLAGLLARWLWA